MGQAEGKHTVIQTVAVEIIIAAYKFPDFIIAAHKMECETIVLFGSSNVKWLT